MGIAAHGMDWPELALRFAAHAPAVSSAIAGTASLGHLLRNIEAVDRGPFPATLVESLRESFRRHDNDWVGKI
jgi:aryl-alcohol dehydrogenase-like predicted oxidoreductase